MRAFGLHPDQVIARSPSAELPSKTCPAFAMSYGALAVGLVSVLAYSIWAFRLIRENGTMYAVIAAVYIGLSGVALSRLVIGRGVAARFAGLFALAFLAYAVAWCAFWFGLRGKNQADLWGALAGLAAMTWLLQKAFGVSGDFLRCFLVLFALHSAGYYLGDYLHDTLRDAAGRRTATGRLLWGAAHGVGFGAGLGFLLYRCQQPLKLRLRSTTPA